MPGSKLEQHWVSLPKVAVQIAEGREIGEVAGQLYQALSDGLLVAEAEIHRIYTEPTRGGKASRFGLEWPRIEKLSRDWWAYGQAQITGPGTNAFQSDAVPVASFFPQLLEALAKKGMEGRELNLSKPYGNRAGGNPSDRDIATKIRCLRSDVERIFGEAKDKPPPRGRSPKPAPDRRFSDAALRVWYEQRVKDHAKDERPPSRDDDLAAARKEFGDGMPRDPVWALRRDLLPVKWKKGGRPKTGGRKPGGN